MERIPVKESRSKQVVEVFEMGCRFENVVEYLKDAVEQGCPVANKIAHRSAEFVASRDLAFLRDLSMTQLELVLDWTPYERVPYEESLRMVVGSMHGCWQLVDIKASRSVLQKRDVQEKILFKGKQLFSEIEWDGLFYFRVRLNWQYHWDLKGPDDHSHTHDFDHVWGYIADKATEGSGVEELPMDTLEDDQVFFTVKFPSFEEGESERGLAEGVNGLETMPVYHRIQGLLEKAGVV